MNIEEAIKETRNNYYTARDFVGVDYVRAIETVLNELDKKDKIKNKIKNKIKKYNNLRIVAETKEINDMFVNYIDCLEELLEE